MGVVGAPSMGRERDGVWGFEGAEAQGAKLWVLAGAPGLELRGVLEKLALCEARCEAESAVLCIADWLSLSLKGGAPLPSVFPPFSGAARGPTDPEIATPEQPICVLGETRRQAASPKIGSPLLKFCAVGVSGGQTGVLCPAPPRRTLFSGSSSRVPCFWGTLPFRE